MDYVIPEDVTNSEVLSDRETYSYGAHQQFRDPFVVGGTNRVVSRSPVLQVVDTNQKGSLDELISKCSLIEDGMDICYVNTPGQLELDVTESGESLILKYAGSTFAFEPSSRALNQFGVMLGVKPDLIKRTPARILKSLLGHFYSLKTYERLGIIYRDDQSGAHPMIVHINEVKDEDNIPWEGRVVALSDVLGVTRNSLTRDGDGYSNGVDLRLQSFVTAYTGNQPAHKVFLQLRGKGWEEGDDPLAFHVEDDLYRPGISIDADYSGANPTIKFQPMYFREICSNGMQAPWNADERKQVVFSHINQQLMARGYAGITIDQWDNPPQDVKELVRTLTTQSYALFKDDGLTFSLQQFSLDLLSPYLNMLNTLLAHSGHYLRSRLAELANPFEFVSHEQFLEIARECARQTSAMSSSALKTFVMEYEGSVMDTEKQSTAFRTPLDVLHYFTYLAQAYPPKEMQRIQGKILVFVGLLKDKISEKAQEHNKSPYVEAVEGIYAS